MIEIPPEFPKMGAGFDHSILDAYPEVTNAYAFALSQVTRSEQQVIRRFLTQVLETVQDSGELHDIWRASTARTWFASDEHLRLFLREIIRRIDLGTWART